MITVSDFSSGDVGAERRGERRTTDDDTSASEVGDVVRAEGDLGGRESWEG